MFAESPGINAVEHPVFDVWLTDCQKPKGTVAQRALPTIQTQRQRCAAAGRRSLRAAPPRAPLKSPQPSRHGSRRFSHKFSAHRIAARHRALAQSCGELDEAGLKAADPDNDGTLDMAEHNT